MNRNTRHSLSKQLIGLILSLYFGIAVALTLVQLISEFNQEKDNLTHQITGLSETFSPTITEALWSYQNEQVLASLKGLYKNAEVFGSVIENTDGEQWHLGYYIDKEGEVVSHTSPEIPLKTLDLSKAYHTLYAHTLALIQEDEGTQEHLGTMTIYYSSSTVIDRTWQTFVITIIGAIVKTLCLWGISVFVINRLISKPLGQLKDDIDNVDVKSVDPDILSKYQPLSSKNNELHELGESFKAFCSALVESNQEVANYRANLEEKVEQRTHSLNETLKELTLANQVKSDFLAVMSHEIRTPMSAVIGTVQILKKTPLTEEQVKLVDTITHGGKTLITLINDILDLSKMDAGKLELESVPLNIVRLIELTVDAFSPTAQDKGIELNQDRKLSQEKAAEDDSLWVKGDPTRLSQVLNNLVGNAIKFTEEGSVQVSIDNISENQDDIKFSIVIKDTGIGLTQEQQAGLFEAFSQADSSTTRKYGGTGLGLTICQRLVKAMDGEIVVESDGHSGSVFSVILQLPKSEPEAEDVAEALTTDSDTKPDTQQTSSAWVLLVDDVLMNRQIAGCLLEHAGYQVLTAEDGEEAVKLFKEKEGTIDIILMDCLMPNMDGYEATRCIRSIEQEENFERTPIIALTANAIEHVKDECLDAGMDDCLSKPFEEAELMKRIKHFISV